MAENLGMGPAADWGAALAFLVSLPADMIVCPDGSGNFTELDEAIQYANDGDIIEYCDQAFVGADGQDPDVRYKVIVLRSGEVVTPLYVFYREPLIEPPEDSLPQSAAYPSILESSAQASDLPQPTGDGAPSGSD